LRRLEDVDRRKVAVPGLVLRRYRPERNWWCRGRCRFSCNALIRSRFRAGAMIAGVLFSGQCGKIHLRRAPTFMAQGAAGGRARPERCRYEPDEVRVARGRLDGRAFDAVNHRLECDIAARGSRGIGREASRTAAPTLVSSEYEAISSIRKSTTRESRWRMVRICSAPVARRPQAAAGRVPFGPGAACSRRANFRAPSAFRRKARRERGSRRRQRNARKNAISNWWLQ